MQLFVIALVVGIFIHDMPGVGTRSWSGHAATILALWLGPKLALWLLYTLACRFTHQMLGAHHGQRVMRMLGWLSGGYRWATLILYGLDLRVGVLNWLRRSVLGTDPVLLDEVIFIVPTLLMILGAWWSYYPIDRRLREAALIGQLDAGQPIHAIWTRSQYLLAQFRHQVAVLLLPLLLMLGWYEVVALYAGGTSATTLATVLTIGGVGCVFLVSPVMIRHLWDTQPLPEGLVRQRLADLCARHRVGYRQLLLWRTFGGMVNAAVMGVLAPLRYILLTDALLERMLPEQVEAVMAHEVAHVRRRHMVWLLLVAGAALVALQTAAAVGVEMVAHSLEQQFVVTPLDDPMTRDLAALALTAGAWVAVFGYVSRRYERQADAFAVVHLSSQQPGGGTYIGASAVSTVVGALGLVAQLNCIPPARRSWRHGSIASRQAYLRTLVGRRADDLDIDRTVQWINFVGVATVAVLLGAYWMLGDQVRWL